MEWNKFDQVVHCAVYPSTTLGHEYLPAFWRHGPGTSVEDVLRLVLRVKLQQYSSQIAILTQVQQIFHVQGIDAYFRVGVNDFATDEKRLSGFRSPDTIHAETTRETGHRSKQRLESFGEIVRYVILVDLDHRNKRRLGIGKRCFATNRNKPRVMQESRHHPCCRVWGYHSVGIDLKHKLVECWVHTNDIPDLMMHLEFKRTHWCIVVDPVEESHDDHLRIALASITGPGDLGRLANLNNDQERYDMAIDLIQPRVDFTHVVLLHAFTKGLEAQRFRVDGLRDA